MGLKGSCVWFWWMFGFGRGKRIEEKLDQIIELLGNLQAVSGNSRKPRQKSWLDEARDDVERLKFASLRADIDRLKRRLGITDEDYEEIEDGGVDFSQLDLSKLPEIIDNLPIFKQLGPLAPLAKIWVKNWLSNPENLKLLTAIQDHNLEKAQSQVVEIRKDQPIDTSLIFGRKRE